MPPLIDGVAFEGLIADKAFDSNALVAELNDHGARIVISQHPGRAQKLKIDPGIYKWRRLIENFFCKLKQFRAIATRYDKTARNFLAAIYLASTVIWLN